MINITSISKDQFALSDPAFRCIVHESPRKFACLRLSTTPHQLFLSWRSDLIDPVVARYPGSSAVWVGVDQRVACVGDLGNIMFCVGLSSPLLDVKPFEKFTVIVCEIQAIVVGADFSICRIADLKEIPSEVTVEDGRLMVEQIDGRTEFYAL